MLSSCSFSWRTGAEQGSNSAGTLGKLLQPLPGCPAQHRHGRQAAETGKGSALGAERKRRPKPDKADSTFPAWQRAGKRGGSRKHLSLELPAEVAEPPGRCHSLSTGASRGSAGGLGSPKANNGARSGLSLALPRAQTPPFCQVGPKSSLGTLGAKAPLYPTHPTHFPSCGAPRVAAHGYGSRSSPTRREDPGL